MPNATPHAIVALIVAAGKGVRAADTPDALPKQYKHINGKPLLAYSAQTLAAHPAIDALYVVIGAGQEEQAEAALAHIPHTLVQGGATRQASVYAGLEAIAARGGASHVLIHDAARPFLPPHVIEALLAALAHHAAAVPALPLADTLAYSADGALLGHNVERHTHYRIQTPQAFAFPEILAAHRQFHAQDMTDDAQLIQAQAGQVALVAGDAMLEKITRPQDFAMAEARLATQNHPTPIHPSPLTRSAMGFDVHKFGVGDHLWLCGVRIPHTQALIGHSDADVALHALTDALLGSIAAGDIGQHFPPSDLQWRGAPSATFLAHALALLREKNTHCVHADLTLICEKPHIAPHRTAMRERLSALMGLPLEAISVKATTTEGLGFTGRGEGIAAQALVTVITHSKDMI
jgi:2-C-methyl-D-erythritol 4-phosphate cytidylyltransferase / 2-C-methyl-D-erythritol 2,4-cyclodiphosphate synthase